MFDMPGFNPAALSDEQLLDRTNELSMKLAFAAAFTNNGGVEQIQNMIDLIENERMERLLQMQHMNEMRYDAAIIESDPSLKVNDKAQTSKTPGKPVRTRPAVVRTSAPVIAAPPALPVKNSPTSDL